MSIKKQDKDVGVGVVSSCIGIDMIISVHTNKKRWRIFVRKIIFGMKVCVCTVLVVLVVIACNTEFFNDVVETRLSKGAEGERVVLIQQKLTELGLYSGKCDGVYDVKTADAVRRFQKHNGIDESGACDRDTLDKLGLNIYTYSDLELDMLARLIEAEAGKEGLQAMTAVGAVVMNRVMDRGYPDSILQVIWDAGAFTTVDNGSFLDSKASDLAYRAAEDAMIGIDPTDGALYVFHNTTNDRTVTLKCGDVYFTK